MKQGSGCDRESWGGQGGKGRENAISCEAVVGLGAEATNEWALLRGQLFQPCWAES
jgi:hypothetical protein